MPAGYLSSYFEGIASKRLSAVEADPGTSNQHEINGVQGLKQLFGTARRTIAAQFVYLGENEEQALSASGFLTWYDARENHPTRSEHRLYFPTTSVSGAAREGDLLVIGKRPDGNAMVIVVAGGSTYENQLSWLFGLPGPSPLFSVHEISRASDLELGFAARFILEELGIEVEKADENWLDRILQQFPSGFPATRIFSAFARETVPRVASGDDPDLVLMSWLEQEEMLFRTLEKHIVAKRLEGGFGDVEDFISYSLSVQNRRKSRVGYALENHLEEILRNNRVTYARGQETENKAKPDFVFPGITHYRNRDFPEARLTMLGVKSTCKDRWRQVLSEAARISPKHLLTLEPGISENQTDEMKANSLNLVVPETIHATYRDSQKEWLVDVKGFIALVRERQQ